MLDADANADAQAKNKIFAAAVKAAGTPLAAYAQPWTSQPPPDEYKPFLPNSHNAMVQVRANDGIHFTTFGYDLVMDSIYPAILASLKQRGRDLNAECPGGSRERGEGLRGTAQLLIWTLILGRRPERRRLRRSARGVVLGRRQPAARSLLVAPEICARHARTAARGRRRPVRTCASRGARLAAAIAARPPRDQRQSPSLLSKDKATLSFGRRQRYVRAA